MKTITIEGHPTATRTGAFCDVCFEFAVTVVDVVVVEPSAPLDTLRRATGSLCQACGAED